MLLAVIIGGFIGSLFAGPIGFILGGLAAVIFLQYSRQHIGAGLAAAQNRYLDTMFAVMGALCKADGVVTPDEVQAAERIFNQLRLSGSQREAAIASFTRGKSSGFDLDAELAAFRTTSRGHPALVSMFLQIQISAIAADGHVHAAEHQMLLRIAHGLGLPASQVEQLEAMLSGGRPGRGSSPQPLAEAYKLLGVSATVSDADLKRAYRKLMNENHPDKLAGQGLPESMREMAEKKTQEIVSAYELIEAARRSR